MTQSELIKRFGDPRGKFAKANPGWEDANLVYVELPYRMRASWDGRRVSVCRVHKDMEDSLVLALEDVYAIARAEIKRKYGYTQSPDFYDKKTLVYLRWLGLDVFGGIYSYRVIRGGHTLSTHAFGAAIDIDPRRNGMGTKGSLPDWFVGCFETNGFDWGGNWKRPDPMHFEYTKL